MRSMVSRLAPSTLMPIGVRIPVDSMSMRVLIGMVQALVQPGISTMRLSSATSWSQPMRRRSGHSGRRAGRSHSGAQLEYQRLTGSMRHWSRGLSWTTVSTIDSGAGSVALSERPALPNTRATSGTERISRSWICR